MDFSKEDDALEDSYSEAFDLLFRDCDKKTPRLPPSLPAKFFSLIEACSLEFCEIPPLVLEESCVSV